MPLPRLPPLLGSSREGFRCFRFRELLGSEALDVLGGLPFHLRRPLARPLQQGLHFAGPPDDLRGRHFVRRWCQSRWPPGDSQRPASQSPPPRRASIVCLVLGHAPRRRRRTGSRTCDDRFSSLNATFAEAASERRGPRRVQAVVAQRLPGIHAPVVAVGQEGRPRELSGGAREGDSIVALVGGLERSRRVQRRVRQRGIAEGLRGVGVIVEEKMARRVDAGLPVREVQGEGLALLDVAQDLCLTAWRRQLRPQLRAFTVLPSVLCLHLERYTHTGGRVRKTKVRLLLPEVIQVPKFINDATVEIEYQPYRITSGIIHLGSSVLHGHYVAFAIRPEGIWLMDDNRKGQWIPQFTVQQLSNIYMLWATPLTTPSGGP